MKYGVWCALSMLVSGAGLEAKPVGLPNPTGSTCWMNSLLQNLMNMEPFVTQLLLLNQEQKNAPDVKPLVDLIWACRQEAQKSGAVVDKKYTQALHDMFFNKTSLYQQEHFKKLEKGAKKKTWVFGKNPERQHDPGDALLNWAGYSRGTNDQLFNKLFVPKVTYTEVATQWVPELNMMLDNGRQPGTLLTLWLPLDGKSTTLENLLGSYFKPALLKDERGSRLGDLPEFLLITIGRASAVKDKDKKNQDIMILKRMATKVAVPEELDLAPFLYEQPKDQAAMHNRYNLIGVIVQTGSAKSGHYRTYIKDQYDPNRLWYQCNDSVITPVTRQKGEALQSVTDVTKGYYYLYTKGKDKKTTYREYYGPRDDIAQNCYLLLYRKKSAEAASTLTQSLKSSLDDIKKLKPTGTLEMRLQAFSDSLAALRRQLV